MEYADLVNKGTVTELLLSSGRDRERDFLELIESSVTAEQ